MRCAVGQGHGAREVPALRSAAEHLCQQNRDSRKALGDHLKVASFASRVGVRIRLTLIADGDGPQSYLELGFVKALMRFNNFTTSARKSSEYRCGGLESLLADNSRELSLSPGCGHNAIEFRGFRDGNVNGLLGSEEDFRYLHSGIPACFEHDISLFAERSPAL